jgi:16S rRNA processing protein RimM
LAGDQVVVGYVVRPHGVRGAVVVKPLTDAPDVRFVAGSELRTAAGDHLSLRGVSEHPSGLVLEFTEVTDRDQAQALAGSTLTIDASERIALGDDEFWPDDLIGCRVVDPSGANLGSVVAVEFGAAQDRLVIETADGRRGEVPFVDALVPEVDVEHRVMVADLPDGLLG